MEEGGISVCCLRHSFADAETVCPERKWRENGTLRDSSPRIARGGTSIINHVVPQMSHAA